MKYFAIITLVSFIKILEAGGPGSSSGNNGVCRSGVLNICCLGSDCCYLASDCTTAADTNCRPGDCTSTTDCSTALSSTTLSSSLSYTFTQGSGNQELTSGVAYTDFFTHTGPSNCPLDSCSLKVDNGGGCTGTPSFSVSMNSNNGPIIDTTNAQATITACLWCNAVSSSFSDAVQSDTFDITINAVCNAAAVKSSASTELAALTSNSFSYTIDGNQPTAAVVSSLTAPSTCPITSYKIYAAKTDTTEHSSLSLSTSGGSISVQTTSSSAYSTAATTTFFIKVEINSGADSFWLESTSPSDQFSFAVSCPSVTFTEASDQAAAQHVATGAAAKFVLPSITPSSTVCGTLAIQISSSNSGIGAVTGMGAVALSSGTYSVAPSATSTEAKYEFYIHASMGGSDEYYSSLKTLVVGCPSDIGSYSISINQGSYPSSLTDSQSVTANLATTLFKLRAFTSTSSICPVATYEIFTSNGGSTAPTGLNSPTSSGSDMVVAPSDNSLASTYTFYLKVSIQGGAVADWSGPLSLAVTSVSCPASGVTVTLGAYSSSYTNSQEVPVNQASTKFVLPAFSVSDAACTITYETSSAGSGTVSAVTGLPNPVLSGSVYVVVPTDITAEATYSFFVKASSSDGAVFTSALTLRVGCPSGGAAFSDGSNTTPVSIGLSSLSNVAVFTFTNPSVTGTNCAHASNSLIDVQVDGSTDASALAFTSGCVQPCSVIESSSISTVQVITFKVKSTVNALNEHTSPLFTINVACASTANSITSSIAAATVQLDYQGAVTSQTYSTFSCAVSACCLLTYSISSSSSSILPVSGLATSPTVSAGSLTVDIPVSSVQTFEFWIHASNAEGISAVSGKVTVNVVADCSSYPPLPSTVAPSTSELTSSSANANITFARQTDLSYKGFISAYAETMTTYSVDISARFAGQYSASICPNSNFKISKVTKDGGTVDVSGLLAVTSAGVLTISDFTKTFSNYTIFMQAYNGALWSSDYEIMDISIISVPVVLPQVAPTLTVVELEAQAFTKSVEGSNTFSITLPEATDLNNDAITYKILNLESFMTFDSETKTISVDLSAVDESATYELEVVVVDSTDRETTYTQVIEVGVPEVEEAEQVNPEAPGQTIQIGFVPSGNGPEVAGQLVVVEEEKPIIGAHIKSISGLGLVTIAFNSTMNQLEDISWLNSSSMDLYISPAQDREFPAGAINISEWSAMNFTQEGMLTLKLSFSKPLEISPLEEQDTLVVHLKEPARTYFYSSALRQYLDPAFFTMKRKIRKQMPDTSLTQSFQSGAESTEASLLWVMVAVFVLNFVLSGGMIYMLMLVRYLQIVLHIPIMKVIIPSNLGILFSIILPVATFDLLSPEWTTQVVLTFDDDKQVELQDDMLDQMVDLGYETHSSLLNLGSLALFTLLYISRVVYFLGLCLVSKATGRFGEQVKSLYSSLFYGEIIAILIDAYFEFLIAGYLQVKAPLTSTLGEKSSFAFGIFGMFLVLVFLPACMAMMMKQPLEKLREKEFEESWGELYDGMRVTSKWDVAYYPLFVSRRIIYVGLAIFSSKLPQFQILGLIFLNLAMMIYTGQVQPRNVRLLRRIENFNEISTLFVMLSLLWFTSWLPNEELKFSHGWSTVLIVVFTIMLNLTFVLISGGRQIYIVGVFLWVRAKHWLKKMNDSLFPKAEVGHSMEQAQMIQKVHKMHKYAQMKRNGLVQAKNKPRISKQKFVIRAEQCTVETDDERTSSFTMEGKSRTALISPGPLQTGQVSAWKGEQINNISFGV